MLKDSPTANAMPVATHLELYACAVRRIICVMVKSHSIGDGHPTFNRNPYNGYTNPYYWVDDHPLLYGNNGSLDPGTYKYVLQVSGLMIESIQLSWTIFVL